MKKAQSQAILLDISFIPRTLGSREAESSELGRVWRWGAHGGVGVVCAFLGGSASGPPKSKWRVSKHQLSSLGCLAFTLLLVDA